MNYFAFYCTQWPADHNINEGNIPVYHCHPLWAAQQGDVSMFCHYKSWHHFFLGGGYIYSRVKSPFLLLHLHPFLPPSLSLSPSHPPKWLHPPADISYVHKVCVCYEHISQDPRCVVVCPPAILSVSLTAVIIST